MASRRPPLPSPSPRVGSGARTPTRRGVASPSTRAGASQPTAKAASPVPRRKPRPEWNTYLTDDAQYRLSREQQLVKHMQQLSAAHFHARSPSAHSRTPDGTRQRSSRAEEPLDASTKERMQGELELLERMLSDLECEAGRLYVRKEQVEDEYAEEEEHGGSELESVSTIDYQEQHDSDPRADTASASSSESFEDPVASICYKSLRVAIDLTHKMQLMAKELESERWQLRRQERRLQELEQVCLETQQRCDEAENRYEEVVGQLEGMRDAMIATEEAVHRLTKELVRSRERPQRKPLRQRVSNEIAIRTSANSAQDEENDPIVFHFPPPSGAHKY